MNMWPSVKHFIPEEFDDPDVPGSWEYMDSITIIFLNSLRASTGWPIVTHNKFGLRGCVCMGRAGHSENSRHYADHPEGCSAVDWHFHCDADPRDQAKTVIRSNFGGIGIYYDWSWNGKPLPIGFHTDRRKRYQVWKREKGKYFYLLK